MYIYPRHAPPQARHLLPCQGIAHPPTGKVEEHPHSVRERRHLCRRQIARGL